MRRRLHWHSLKVRSISTYRSLPSNTLPIRRLRLQPGQSEEILAVYVQLPGLTVTTDRQRYTCLEPGRLYRYESIDSEFTRDIEVDDQALVVTYPGLFRRVL